MLSEQVKFYPENTLFKAIGGIFNAYYLLGI
jgi:hypothetical protein